MIIRSAMGRLLFIVSLLPFIASRPSLSTQVRDSICTNQCDAQFKSDFRLSFDRDYDLDFFDVPLDPLLVSSLQNLTAYCFLVEQKQECYKNECDLSCEMDVSEQELCVRKGIRDNIGCLRETSRYVNKDCSRLCGSLSFLPGERTLSNTSLEEHKHCVFIHCHRMCQESLVSRICPSQTRRAAHEAVRAYYSTYQHEDLRAFVEENNDTPSSFCRRVSGYEEKAESRSVHNRNLQILQGIKDTVKEMVETL